MAEKKFILKNAVTGIEVELRDALLVGREEGCGLRLLDGNLSRKHALITIKDDTVTVEDRKSTNGTFVNSQRIAIPTALKSGDRLAFDIVEFVFRVEGGVEVSDKTVIRSRESPPPPPPPVAGPVPIAAPPAVAASNRNRVPPPWTENPGAGAGNKTMFKTMEEMERERLQSQAAGSEAFRSAAVDAPTLLIDQPAGPPLPLQLRPDGTGKAEWTVGSDAARSIQIVRNGVSAWHATIINQGPRWKLVDQVSANGTFVNGKRSTMSYLNSGDKIAFGPATCVFQLPVRGTGSEAMRAGTVRGNTESRPNRFLVIAAVSFVATVLLILILYGLLRRSPV